MFLNFKIANYRSIGKELAIDFSIRDSQRLGAFAEVNDQAINNIACLVGPNASGKSNIFKGIVYFIRCMNMSYSIPYYRYSSGRIAHFCCQDLPTEFSTEFIDEKTQYKYEVSILDGKVQKEILQKRDETTKRYSYVFKRETGKPLALDKTVKINKRDSNRLGDDMSLFSLLLELNYFEETDFMLLRKFYSNVHAHPGVSYVGDNLKNKMESISQMLYGDNILFDELSDELKAVDTGISSLKLNKEKIKRAGSGEILEWEKASIQTNHKVADKNFSLGMLEESGGTLHYMYVFTTLFHVLQDGGMFIADELEQSLHPDLTGRIISRFMDKDKNPNNAQLLFTTHNPWFLQDLTKTQIFITEKNDKAETEVTRLDDIAGVRNDENYFMKYIAGEYDGRPKIKDA
jgi:AAA15 family ATPase/GTPase